MIVNFVVRTNLGLGINICMSLAMCMGPRMKKNMIQRKGRSFITDLSLADLSLAALRLTALSLAQSVSRYPYAYSYSQTS